jgi:hypothetical protein
MGSDGGGRNYRFLSPLKTCKEREKNSCPKENRVLGLPAGSCSRGPKIPVMKAETGPLTPLVVLGPFSVFDE